MGDDYPVLESKSESLILMLFVMEVVIVAYPLSLGKRKLYTLQASSFLYVLKGLFQPAWLTHAISSLGFTAASFIAQ